MCMKCGTYTAVKPPLGFPGLIFNNGLCAYEHHVVLWQQKGVRLKSNECVHHINGNPRDNRIENLQIETRSEHARHHMSKQIGQFIVLKCPNCNQIFQRRRGHTPLIKSKKSACFCSSSCVGRYLSKHKDFKSAIKGNVVGFVLQFK